MKLLDLVHHKDFLDKIFPDGRLGEVIIAQVCVDSFGSTTLNVHVKQKPAVAVPKWGQWGKDYNTVAIKLSSVTVRNFRIENIQEATYSGLIMLDLDGGYLLHQEAGRWVVQVEFENFIFQRCEVYMADFDGLSKSSVLSTR